MAREYGSRRLSPEEIAERISSEEIAKLEESPEIKGALRDGMKILEKFKKKPEASAVGLTAESDEEKERLKAKAESEILKDISNLKKNRVAWAIRKELLSKNEKKTQQTYETNQRLIFQSYNSHRKNYIEHGGSPDKYPEGTIEIDNFDEYTIKKADYAKDLRLPEQIQQAEAELADFAGAKPFAEQYARRKLELLKEIKALIIAKIPDDNFLNDGDIAKIEQMTKEINDLNDRIDAASDIPFGEVIPNEDEDKLPIAEEITNDDAEEVTDDDITENVSEEDFEESERIGKTMEIKMPKEEEFQPEKKGVFGRIWAKAKKFFGKNKEAIKTKTIASATNTDKGEPFRDVIIPDEVEEKLPIAKEVDDEIADDAVSRRFLDGSSEEDDYSYDIIVKKTDRVSKKENAISHGLMVTEADMVSKQIKEGAKKEKTEFKSKKAKAEARKLLGSAKNDTVISDEDEEGLPIAKEIDDEIADDEVSKKFFNYSPEEDVASHNLTVAEANRISKQLKKGEQEEKKMFRSRKARNEARKLLGDAKKEELIKQKQGGGEFVQDTPSLPDVPKDKEVSGDEPRVDNEIDTEEAIEMKEIGKTQKIRIPSEEEFNNHLKARAKKLAKAGERGGKEGLVSKFFDASLAAAAAGIVGAGYGAISDKGEAPDKHEIKKPDAITRHIPAGGLKQESTGSTFLDRQRTLLDQNLEPDDLEPDFNPGPIPEKLKPVIEIKDTRQPKNARQRPKTEKKPTILDNPEIIASDTDTDEEGFESNRQAEESRPEVSKKEIPVSAGDTTDVRLVKSEAGKIAELFPQTLVFGESENVVRLGDFVEHILAHAPLANAELRRIHRKYKTGDKKGAQLAEQIFNDLSRTARRFGVPKWNGALN